MLSGDFSSIAIDDISINRDERVRKNVSREAIDEMADSINRLGLIHPIVLDRDHNLVAGETRLSACKSLGWAAIPFQYADTLDSNDLLAIELEENVKRKDLDWKDRTDAVRRYHQLQVETHETWTITETAKSLGYTPTHISNFIGVSEAIESGDNLVVGASRLTTAINIVARKRERAATDVISTINEISGVKPSSEILVEDFNLWAPRYTGIPFNFIHCDFPYGINHDKSPLGSSKDFGAYADTEEVYWGLLQTRLDNKSRLLSESAHIIFWFSMNHYARTLSVLSTAFNVEPHPLIWHKSDNVGITPDPQRGPRRIYETAFFCTYGERKVVQSVANAFFGPTEKISGHTSEKSENMLKHFFRMMVDTHTRLLDPTAGSASSLRAAKSMGASSVLGLELNEEFAKAARRTL